MTLVEKYDAVYYMLAYEIFRSNPEVYYFPNGRHINYDGIDVRIATPETLYYLKKDTIRHKDRFDAAYLLDIIKNRQAKAARNKDG